MTTSAFDTSGMFKRVPDLPLLDPAAEEAYVRRYLTSFTRGGLSGLRVLVYQHSAVGRDILPQILRELGAEVVTAGRSDTFVSIDMENITDEQLDRLEEFAVLCRNEQRAASRNRVHRWRLRPASGDGGAASRRGPAGRPARALFTR